jgi:MFS family permease
MMAIFTFPAWIFIARTTDRLGKGLRTGARDALLSDEASPATKARVFGFHRGMDTLGAVIGPSIALTYLYFTPGDYVSLFYFAFLPGIISVLVIYLAKENKKRISTTRKDDRSLHFFSFLQYWKLSSPVYRRLVTGLLIFTLCNSSDYFLLLKMKEAGINDTYLIGVYIFYNLVFAASAYPLGTLADRIGLKKVFLTGLVVFATVYLGMAFSRDLLIFFLLFFLYGIYAAATEGISKAWITNISNKEETATAIGTYTALQSICTMLASALAGLVWIKYGAEVIFTVSAGGALLAGMYIFARVKYNKAGTFLHA